jgi:hypothetical protein
LWTGPGTTPRQDASLAEAEAEVGVGVGVGVGVDELYVAPIGPHYREMIELYAREIVPNLA